jgi:glycosyltransferase involved in cell wall biosynthesis
VAVRKIVIVDINQFFGGGQVYGLQVAPMLTRDFEVTVICVNKRFADELKRLDIHVVDYSGLLSWGRIFHQLLITAVCVWLRLIGQADLVWLNGIPEIVVTPFCRVLGCRVVVTRHLTLDIEVLSRLKRTLRVIAEIAFRYGAPFANKVICVSGAVRDSMATILPAEKLEVIHNWVSELPKQVKVGKQESESCKLLFVGRLEPHKGPFLIIEAMKLLAADGEAGRVTLTAVGQGRARDTLESAARGLDVQFMGFQEEPARFYSKADVFVNPTKGPEGLPLVTLDAMSYGLPCILSDLPVHVEVSEGGCSALLFRSGDPADLAEKIKILLRSDALRKEYGDRARKTIESDYVLGVAREKYIRLINSLGR